MIVMNFKLFFYDLMATKEFFLLRNFIILVDSFIRKVPSQLGMRFFHDGSKGQTGFFFK